jgi:hypothetical protein
MRIHVILFGLIALSACEGDARQAALPSVGTPAAKELAGLEADVSSTCVAGARWWQASTAPEDSALVTRVDTVLAPPLGERRVLSCVVRVWLPHGLQGSRALAGAGDDRVPPALGNAEGEWRRLLRYDADGPDGNLSGYQRAHVRCTVAQGWDGGDDSDSTYVPGDWYRQELTCWAAPGGVAEADTTG